MRTGAAAECEGIFHEAAVYGTDAELCEAVVPFLTEGVAAGEPTYVIMGPGRNDAVRAELGPRDGIRYLSAPEVYLRPAATVKGYRDVLAAHAAEGAGQVRFLTEVPHPGLGAAWDWWGRYEAAVNKLFLDFPVWAICAYDERTTPAPVIDEALRTHPFIVGSHGSHGHNRRYQSPSEFLASRTCSYADPIETSRPAAALTDPTVSMARRVAVEAAHGVVDTAAAADLAVAVSEVVANAQLHGSRPVTLRIWAGADRVLAAISDRGPGIADPTAGLAPVSGDATDGRGLWIAHQLCSHVTMDRSGGEFTVRLVVGTPSLAS